jgi:segregation and condensation protein A
MSAVAAGSAVSAGSADPAGSAASVVSPELEEGAGGFTVTLENFDGPFDLLLSLIARREMDVTAVALSVVTDEFIAYVRQLSADGVVSAPSASGQHTVAHVDGAAPGDLGGSDRRPFSAQALDESSHFILIAATLLDLKAAQLLPGSEVESEEDIAALEARDLLFARLLQYRAFKEIAAHVQQRLDFNARRFPRVPGTHPDLADVIPELIWRTPPEELKEIAEKAFARPALEPDDVGLDHLHTHPVTVREEMATMAARLRSAGRLGFGDLVSDAENRLVVVVRFLGLLELYRELDIELEQDSPLAELHVVWTGASGREDS